jgi:hypothetical protein
MSRSSIIQLYNLQRDPVFMDMSTGKLLWILSNDSLLEKIVYVSHYADDGKVYFENVDTTLVSWNLPKDKMSLTASDTAELVFKLSRKALENKIGEKYDPLRSTQQMNELDNYLRDKDAERMVPLSNENSSGEEFEERPSRAIYMKTADMVKKNIIKVRLLDFFLFTFLIWFLIVWLFDEVGHCFWKELEKEIFCSNSLFPRLLCR